MKKMFVLLMALLLMTSLAWAEGTETPVPEEPAWWVVDDAAHTLTVTLPANATTGYAWLWQLDELNRIQLVSEEYLPDAAPEGMLGTGGTWQAVFAPTMESAGETVLLLRYARAWEETPAEEHTLRLMIGEDGAITVMPEEV